MERFRTPDLGTFEVPYTSNETNSSGVSWPAVWAGGLVTAALSLILLELGTGLGFASMSVWAENGVSSSTVGTGAIHWMILMQFISASMGGYLAGAFARSGLGYTTMKFIFATPRMVSWRGLSPCNHRCLPHLCGYGLNRIFKYLQDRKTPNRFSTEFLLCRFTFAVLEDSRSTATLIRFCRAGLARCHITLCHRNEAIWL